MYNPCADPKEIEYFKKLAKGCLRRHVITPYNNLPENELFNIVTFGCKLKLNKIFGQEYIIADYLKVKNNSKIYETIFFYFIFILKRHAIKDGPEFHIPEDGEYNFGLIQKAKIVSDLKDSKICQQIF